MTDAPVKSKTAERDEEIEAAEAERKLGRTLSIGIPAVGIGLAVIVGTVASVGPALLVLIASALLGAIALLWASLRTLGGDAPLAADMEALAVKVEGTSELAARKRAVLRALKDIKHEHDIGKIDAADYRELEAKYRGEAKDILRELDTEVEPFREKAEALAKKHLAKAGLLDTRARESEGADDVPARDLAPVATAIEAEEKRKVCPKCAVLNEPDAAFCKKCGTAMENPVEAADSDIDAEEKHA